MLCRGESSDGLLQSAFTLTAKLLAQSAMPHADSIQNYYGTIGRHSTSQQRTMNSFSAWLRIIRDILTMKKTDALQRFAKVADAFQDKIMQKKLIQGPQRGQTIKLLSLKNLRFGFR